MDSRPAWQTEELEDEWPDDDEELDLHDGTRSVSLTLPIGSLRLHGEEGEEDGVDEYPEEEEDDTGGAAGTFLVRQDAPAAVLPKTPGQKKNAIKDFFSPLPLERMFEPPSPPKPSISSAPYNPSAPAVPSRLSQQRKATRSPSLDCQFTFAVPHFTPSNALTPNSYPQAQSTPGPSQNIARSAPPTDPRLRLFQFQYDTFTRDHLSAMVDSIAVNSPSGSNTGNLTGNASSPFGLSRVSEGTVPGTLNLRSAKRVKLSPVSDFYGEGDGERANIQRPLSRKDYVGESKSLMAQIKQARDFSTISTAASGASPAGRSREDNLEDAVLPSERRRSFLEVPQRSSVSSDGNSGSKRDGYSSLGYREQAANLMAQIKQDMKGSKRLFSAETDVSLSGEPLLDNSNAGHSRLPHRRHPSQGSRRFSPAPSEKSEPLSPHQETSDTSFDTSRLYAQFPAPPILVASPASPPPSSPAPQPNAVIFHANPNPSPALLAAPAGDAPAYPSASIRTRTNEDLNRFVSSSTASGSFVKHAGPAQITPLPDRVGKMVFDKATRAKAPASERDGESEDPFRDIESLREEDSERGDGHREDAEDDNAGEMSRIDEVDDEEEMELTSFSFDGPSQDLIRREHGVEDDDATTDSDHDDGELTELLSASMSLADPPDILYDSNSDEDYTLDPAPSSSGVIIPPEPVQHAPAETPLGHRSTSAVPTPIRSVLKNTSGSALSPFPVRQHTPANRTRHRRSVSFSDGKHEGPIKGLRSDESSGVDDDRSSAAAASGFLPSARTKRIAGMMEDLEHTGEPPTRWCVSSHERSPRSTGFDDASPSQDALSRRAAAQQAEPAGRRASAGLASNANASTAGISQRVLTRTHSMPPIPQRATANATFLTEASFGVAHDKLVQVITDVQPFEPYWEELTTIDLSGKRIESVARLKEFLPQLLTLSLNDNQLSWLSGVPDTVRMLSVANNALTRVTSFNQLLNLESLDISHNHLDGLSQLDCLRHLRELRADGNSVSSIEGLQHMACLTKLSLQENRIDAVDFSECSWSRLEMLNMSQNRLEDVKGIASLSSLVVLNLDSNSIDAFEAHGIMPRLRILRLSANRLRALNTGPFPSLRTLYADNNSLAQIDKASRMAKLENLSLRNQGGKGLTLSVRDVRDVKRLYLSGNPLPADFLSEACYNLIYLEIAACRLTGLPNNLPALAPNLRVLNLNYNFLEDVRPLEGLRRLNKLTIIGSRLKGTKGLIRVLRGCPDVEMVDFRMNPCTLGWYLPLLVRDVPGALQPSETTRGGGSRAGGTTQPSADPGEGELGARARGGKGLPAGTGAAASWQDLDAKFRRDLPDEAYVGRLVYRGLVMRACARVRMVDGVLVSRKERDKAERLLAGVARAQG
ncbi:hypothetical protein FA95DRAFT_1580818 [Auriscalpium vulgare]|uniref:Uncharacterized protein n=1 Tax=Auriscalpium vulgare TaxID=40419 RepID=A0ACB8S4J3_9AGAM|nr:hypothetical protein FA95DRAFT_1580818 [Auriscalpium vulgare]